MAPGGSPTPATGFASPGTSSAIRSKYLSSQSPPLLPGAKGPCHSHSHDSSTLGSPHLRLSSLHSSDASADRGTSASKNAAVQASPNESFLFACIRQGDFAEARALIDKGVQEDATMRRQGAAYRRPPSLITGSAHAQDSRGRTAIHFAAELGEISILTYLLDVMEDNMNKGILVKPSEEQNALPLYWLDFEKNTPLHAASRKSHAQAVKLLLERCTDFARYTNMENDRGCTALHFAASCGDTACIRTLLKFGADPYARGIGGNCPINYAALNSHPEAVLLLADRMSNRFMRNNVGASVLHIVAATSCVPLLHALEQRGLKVNDEQSDGQTPLHAAASQGSLEMVMALISLNASLGHRNHKGCAPLHLAAERGNINIVNALIEAGCDLNPLHVSGNTPLFFAANRGHYDVVVRLLTAGCDCDVRNEQGKSTLHIAAYEGNLQIVQELLSHGGDVNLHDSDGETPLYGCCRRGNASVVRRLLDHGADIVGTRNLRNETPLHIACTKGNADIVRLLVGEGAQIDVADCNGFTPLQKAQGLADVTSIIVNALDDRGCNSLLRYSMELEDPATHRDRALFLETLCSDLIQNNSDLDLRIDNSSVLDIYVRISNKRLAKLVIESGADVNACSPGQLPPLLSYVTQCASLSNDPIRKRFLEEMIDLVVSHGANLNASSGGDGEVVTALDIALSASNAHIADTLFAAQCDVNVGNPLFRVLKEIFSGKSTSNQMSAADWRVTRFPFLVSMAKKIIDAGGDVNVEMDGVSPLDMTLSCGHEELCQCLVAHGADINSKRLVNVVVEELCSGPEAPSRDAFLLKMLDMFITAKADLNQKLGENTALIEAIRCERLDVVTALISGGADPDIGCPIAKVVREISMLPHRSLASNAELKHIVFLETTLSMLTEAKADVNATGVDGKTPLQICLECGNTFVAEMLVKAGAKYAPDVLHRLLEELSTTESATRKEFLRSVVLKMINTGADVTLVDPVTKYCVLDLAIRCRHEGIAMAVLQHGADVNLHTPLSQCLNGLLSFPAAQEFYERVSTEIISRNADLDAAPMVEFMLCEAGACNSACGTLEIAIAASNPIAFTIIERGCDVNNGSVLHAALEELATESSTKSMSVSRRSFLQRICRLLIQNKAEMDCLFHGHSALELAIKARDELALVLVRAGAAVDLQSPLNLALRRMVDTIEDISRTCLYETAKLLIEYGSNVDAVVGGMTPLEMVIDVGHGNDLFDVLLDADADVDLNSPLCLALERLCRDVGNAGEKKFHYESCAKGLIEAGANPDGQSRTTGMNALTLAVLARDITLCKSLVGHSATPNALNKDGTTALCHAISTMQMDVVEWLVNDVGVDISVGVPPPLVLTLSACVACDDDPSKTPFYNQVCMLLIDRGADCTPSVADSDQPLLLLIKIGALDIIRHICVKGVDADAGAPLQVCIDELETADPFSDRYVFLSNACVCMIEAGASLDVASGHVLDRALALSNADVTFAALKRMALDRSIDALDEQGNAVLHRVMIEVSGDVAPNHSRLSFLETVVNAICLNGADVNLASSDGTAALDLALKCGNSRVADSLIRVGAKYGDTVLHQMLAELSSSLADDRRAFVESMCETLILPNAKGEHADLNSAWKSQTPLDLAFACGQSHLARLIIENGADVNVVSAATGKTPLQLLTSELSRSTPNEERLVFLQNVALGLQATGCNCLFEVLRNAGRTSAGLGFASWLLANGADVRQTNADGEAAIHAAAMVGSVDMITSILRSGGDVAAVTNHGRTTLMMAVESGNADSVKTLLSHPVPTEWINAQAGQGSALPRHTALLLAAQRKLPGILSALIAVGADATVVGFYRLNALHLVSRNTEYSSSEAVAEARVLVEAGCSLMACDVDGRVPLLDAVQANRVELISLFISKCPKCVFVSDVRGVTAVDLAAASRAGPALKLLCETLSTAMSRTHTALNVLRNGDEELLLASASVVGSPYNVVADGVGKRFAQPMHSLVTWDSALWWVAYFGHVALVEQFLNRGGSPLARDSGGRTLFHWLAAWGVECLHAPVLAVLLTSVDGACLRSDVDIEKQSAVDWANRHRCDWMLTALGEEGLPSTPSVFPACVASLSRKPLFRFMTIEWRRVTDIALTSSTIDVAALRPGPKCHPLYFAAFATAASTSNWAAACIKHDVQAGVFTAVLKMGTKVVEVMLDDRVPCINGNPAFIDAKETLPLLLERALAYACGSYEGLMAACSGRSDMGDSTSMFQTMYDDSVGKNAVLIGSSLFDGDLLTTSALTSATVMWSSLNALLGVSDSVQAASTGTAAVDNLRVFAEEFSSLSPPSTSGAGGSMDLPSSLGLSRRVGDTTLSSLLEVSTNKAVSIVVQLTFSGENIPSDVFIHLFSRQRGDAGIACVAVRRVDIVNNIGAVGISLEGSDNPYLIGAYADLGSSGDQWHLTLTLSGDTDVKAQLMRL